MANSEQTINLDVKTKGVKEATKKVSGLAKIVKSLSGAFTKAFAFQNVMDYFKSAVPYPMRHWGRCLYQSYKRRCGQQPDW